MNELQIIRGEGDTIKLADIPSGLLTHKIVDKIVAAYKQKGSALTLPETIPFYENAEPQDGMQCPSDPMKLAGLKIDVPDFDADLIPCPFCGGRAEFEYTPWDEKEETGDDGTGWVECAGCRLQAYAGNDRDTAKKLWNTRSTPIKKEVLP